MWPLDAAVGIKGSRKVSMGNRIYGLIRAMAGVEAGRVCRTCLDPIHPRDGFGMSESVCVPCRET